LALHVVERNSDVLKAYISIFWTEEYAMQETRSWSSSACLVHSSTLKMETVCSFVMLVYLWTTQCDNLGYYCS
jgi:hypothetical protein